MTTSRTPIGDTFLPSREEAAILRACASDVARRAGALALQMRGDGLEIAERKSTEFDVATAADIACEQLLRTEIAILSPQDGVLGEEGGGATGTSGLTWVIDPIDGTTNYLYGLPDWSVSVAVVAGPPDDPQRWTAIAASVFQPALGTHYEAARGLGARCNGKALRTPATGTPGRVTDLREALVAVGFHYDPVVRREQAQIAARLSDQVRDLRDHGATSVELCHAAAGVVDGYWEERLAPWDVAAGLLVADEAGCTVAWQQRRRPDMSMEDALFVGGRPELTDQLMAAVASAASAVTH